MSKVSDFKNILVYRIGHLGDTLVALPAFWAIRKAFPSARLTLLTNASSQNPNYVMARSVLPAENLFDDWLTYPTDLSKTRSFLAFGELLLKLKKKKFDCLIYLTTRNRTESQIKRDVNFFRLAGIKRIIGTEYLLQNIIKPNPERPLPILESEQEYLLKCLSAEQIPVNGNIPSKMALTENEKEIAEKWLRENCGDFFTKNDLVAVAPASKWESKVWAEERFEEVISGLIAQKDIFPVVFGGSEDREKGERLIKKWKRGANAAGKLNIREAAAALEKCKLYLGNDTGTMHLAASVETPCVAIFAAIDYAGRWYPQGSGHKIFRETVECEACYAPVCFNNRKCLDAVGVEEVYRAALEILESDKKR
ncbi:MAG TPA: glycosyltransferase family 9 protein [Pyrinomonadaceae bacterium]|nr:glycosyltransferase family 9 protein [Pyrinomonadaceae bacterium]